jgi:hypothetical protein
MFVQLCLLLLMLVLRLLLQSLGHVQKAENQAV